MPISLPTPTMSHQSLQIWPHQSQNTRLLQSIYIRPPYAELLHKYSKSIEINYVIILCQSEFTAKDRK